MTNTDSSPTFVRCQNCNTSFSPEHRWSNDCPHCGEAHQFVTEGAGSDELLDTCEWRDIPPSERVEGGLYALLQWGQLSGFRLAFARWKRVGVGVMFPGDVPDSFEMQWCFIGGAHFTPDLCIQLPYPTPGRSLSGPLRRTEEMNHEICCPKCKGAGKIPLPRHLHDTLEFVRERQETMVLDAFTCLMPDATQNGANNRLSDLEVLGFIRRVRTENKVIFWQAVNEL